MYYMYINIYLVRIREMVLNNNIFLFLKDLVLRFLKRAAGNLQQPFKVVVPSRKLLLNDRRRILSKQLAEFVHIYSRVGIS